MDASVIRLFKKQKTAWDYLHNGHTTEIVYGGGAGGGKSLLGSLWLATEIANKPGSTRGIGRSELKKIKLSTLITFRKMLKEVGFDDDSYKYDDQKSVLTFTNGCLVMLMDLNDNPSDPEFDKLGSMEFSGFFIDEAQEVSAKAKQIVSSRLRNLKGRTYYYSEDKTKVQKWIEDNHKGILSYNKAMGEWEALMWVLPKPKLLMTCNPGRNFIYTDFYKPWVNHTLLNHRTFIQSLPTENPFLPEAYIDNLKNLDKTSRARLLDGNFDYSDDDSLLFSIDDMDNMFNRVYEPAKFQDKYITIDAARQGRDKSIIVIWEGLHILDIRSIKKASLDIQATIIRQLMTEHNIDINNIIVDEVGVGGGLVDMLGCRGFIANAAAIQPLASKYLAYKKRNYANLKTQAFFYIQKYLPNITIYKECLYKEDIIEEALYLRQADIDNDSKIKLESKKITKEKLGRSPDYMDAISFRMWWIIKGHEMGNSMDEDKANIDIKEETDNSFIQGLIEEIDREKNNTENRFEPDTSIFD